MLFMHWTLAPEGLRASWTPVPVPAPVPVTPPETPPLAGPRRRVHWPAAHRGRRAQLRALARAAGAGVPEVAA